MKILPVVSSILLAFPVIGKEVIEINSSTPYSSGVVRFYYENLHFSTGLELASRDLDIIMLEKRE